MREQFNAWFKQHYGDIDTTHFPVGVAEDAFAAGHAAGLEAAAKYVEDEGYTGLPIGIRTMKEGKC